MKLLRLKITDPKGFRSLQPGFEYQFRSAWHLQEEQGFAPFVCAGPNGSGKSNLLEVLAAIFFQLEMLRVRRSFLPEELQESDTNIAPTSFELDYLIKVPKDYIKPDSPEWAHVSIFKEANESVSVLWNNQREFDAGVYETFSSGLLDILLPEYVLGYSSGENEILSLPFFKMRFVQYDEYWDALKQQLTYPGKPESRMVYLDSGFSQAILLSNLLYHDNDALLPLRDDIGIEELKEFRIIIRRSFEINQEVAFGFGSRGTLKRETIEEITKQHPALSRYEDDFINDVFLNLTQLLDGDDDSNKIIPRLKRCATSWFVDESTDNLYLDYYVNDATREAFSENFDFEVNKSPIALFEALQVLLTLNLYTVSNDLKSDLYQSDSLYVTETIPTLASDERIMRIKHFWVSKKDQETPFLLKSFSDGEHQLLHTLGLCLLFKNTNSLFLLDEPETHFNPDWRANFVTQLHQVFGESIGQEMLVTTHTPFLISDSKKENVLVFNKENNEVTVKNPQYNTLGASINKITMDTFGKRETIGGHAQSLLEGFRSRSIKTTEDKEQLLAEINRELGDSVEKVLLIKTILDGMEAQD